MKKILTLLCILTVLISCKNDEKKEANPEIEAAQTEGISQVTGNFMYYADAAVFQTRSELYGVVENGKLEDLILQSEPLKNDSTDEVAVVLKVKKSKKPANEEGWENRIEIIEILKVSKVDNKDSDIIKLGTQDQTK